MSGGLWQIERSAFECAGSKTSICIKTLSSDHWCKRLCCWWCTSTGRGSWSVASCCLHFQKIVCCGDELSCYGVRDIGCGSCSSRVEVIFVQFVWGLNRQHGGHVHQIQERFIQTWSSVDGVFEFDFTILHRPGANNMADALSRRPDLDLNLLTSISTSDSEENSLTQHYQQDRKAQAIIDRLSRSPTDAFHKQYQWDEASQRLFLRWKDTWRLYIPKGNMRLKLLKEYHDLPSAGHQGRHRTYTRMCRHVYWPGMCMDVQRYVRSCDLYQRMKGGRRNNGLLQPLPIPDRPWQDISMDLITGLPLTANGFDAIFTFVDHLSKSVHLCPTSATIDAAGAANLYIQNVFRLHGLSRSIVCDRDPRFTAEFFKEVFSRLGSKLKFSTANHPQTDGQSERANRVVGDIWRSFVNHRQNNWDDCLPFCEFAINDMLQESTKETPFRIVYGWHPTSPADVLNDIIYLRHERVTRKMTVIVSNVSVCYTFFRERNNGRIRSWPRSASDPSIIPLSEEGVTHRNVGDYYCHLSRHPFVSQINYIVQHEGAL